MKTRKLFTSAILSLAIAGIGQAAQADEATAKYTACLEPYCDITACDGNGIINKDGTLQDIVKPKFKITSNSRTFTGEIKTCKYSDGCGETDTSTGITGQSKKAFVALTNLCSPPTICAVQNALKTNSSGLDTANVIVYAVEIEYDNNKYFKWNSSKKQFEEDNIASKCGQTEVVVNHGALKQDTFCPVDDEAGCYRASYTLTVVPGADCL